MERLTERTKNGIAMVKGCGENCKYGFKFCRKEDWENCKTIDDVIDKLATYEDADEQGRLLRLPCKVGATVYLIESNGKVVPRTADMMFLGVLWDEYGKEWFLTKEEAEAKLEEMEKHG